MSSTTPERSFLSPCRRLTMPSIARFTSKGGDSSRASGNCCSIRARVASSRASGSCTPTMPCVPHAMAHRPSGVSKSENARVDMTGGHVSTEERGKGPAPRDAHLLAHAEAARSAGGQPRDRVERIAAIFVTNCLQAVVQLFLPNTARADVGIQVVTRVALLVGDAVPPRAIFLLGTDVLAPDFAVAARRSHSRDRGSGRGPHGGFARSTANRTTASVVHAFVSAAFGRAALLRSTLLFRSALLVRSALLLDSAVLRLALLGSSLVDAALLRRGRLVGARLHVAIVSPTAADERYRYDSERPYTAHQS